MPILTTMAGRLHRAAAGLPDGSRAPTWAHLVVAVAAFRVATALAFYLAGAYNVDLNAPLPDGVYAALMVSFGGLGLLLVVAARNDLRAVWLGGILLLLAVPLTSRFLSQTSSSLATLITRIQVGGFLPAFLWRFTSEFPSPLPASAGRMARILAGASAAFGGAAFAVNLSIVLWPAVPEGLSWRTWLATGQTTTGPGVYWPVLFLLSAIAALSLAARLIRSGGTDRTRAGIFVGGLVVGFMPLFVEVVIEEVWPPYKAFIHSPSVEPWAALPIFGPLSLVPLITTYSVVYDRVVETRLIVRAAIQHALAKYTMALATAIPFAALLFYLYQHRAEPLAALMSGTRPVLLAAATVAGVLSLRSRTRISRAIDRRFFREAYDADTLVTDLVSDRLMARSPSEMAERLRSEIERVIHATADLFVLDESGSWLRDPSGQLSPLSGTSVLLSLAMADAKPMDLQLDGASPLDRLPAAERAWIQGRDYRLLLPILSREGEVAGLLALTGKRSELPFSDTDRRSIGALAPPLGLALENERLRHGTDASTDASARQCSSCSRMYAHDVAGTCPACGGTLADAAAPHVLRGVFRLERRIGAGGMGIVYRATDLNLRRDVAIKTLPRMSPDLAVQLKREARAMASLIHQNLAVIYGIESWRGTPFLVEEFMAGGTLANRLHAGAMPVAQALDLGIALAGVIQQLHRAGVVHCDIKPSNIGFSQHGTVKLLDFGIAYLLRDAATSLTTTMSAPSDAAGDPVVTGRGAVGTPAYMSPEALVGRTPSPSFDLWSLSVVLFEAMAGQRPFAGRDFVEVIGSIARADRPSLVATRSDCPEAVSAYLERSLSLDSGERPQTATELLTGLQALRAVVS